jgi:hypothetical protein
MGDYALLYFYLYIDRLSAQKPMLLPMLLLQCDVSFGQKLKSRLKVKPNMYMD